MPPLRVRFRSVLAVSFVLLAAVATAKAAPPDVSAGPAALGANTAHIDALDAVVPGRGAFWVLPGPTTSVPLSLDSPSVGDGSITFSTTGLPDVDTAHFVDGQQTVDVPFSVLPTAPVSTWSGWGVKRAAFSLLFGGGGVVPGQPDMLTVMDVEPLAGRGDGLAYCYVCMVQWLNCCADYRCGGICVSPGDSAGRSVGGDAGVLTRYRDEVLALTPAGQYYTDLYAQLSADAIFSSLQSPSHLVLADRVLADWIPAIQSLLDGAGSGVTVTAPMQTELLELLAMLEAHGSPALAQAIATERTRLQLDSIAGLTLDEFQDQVETLGGTNAVESRSWGRLKAEFR